MNEPNDPTNTDRMPSEEPPTQAGRRAGNATLTGISSQEKHDFEADALLDSLLNDPFPSPASTKPPEVPIQNETTLTTLGELDALLSDEIAESFTASAPSSIPAPPSAPNPIPPISRLPAAPPRPRIPRPGGRASSDPPSLRPVSLRPVSKKNGSIPADEEETLLLRSRSEPATLEPPTFPPPASVQTPGVHSASVPALEATEATYEEDPFEPESFVPPAASYPPESTRPATNPALDSVRIVPSRSVAIEAELPGSASKSRVASPSAQRSITAENPLLREAWIERAELFEVEAQRATRPEVKARTLLTASEVWSMLGEFDRARSAAEAAALAEPNNLMAGRQLRWLAASEHDYETVVTKLDHEAEHTTSDAARVHARYFAAEVLRLPLGDAAGARERLEQLSEAAPTDPRAQLTLLAGDLGANKEAPERHVPSAEAHAPFKNALGVLAFLRGKLDVTNVPQTLQAFDAAERALANGQRTLAADAILRLAEVEGLEDGATWLASALFSQDSQHPDSRTRAVELLRALTAGSAGTSAARALVARALELGDYEAVAHAIANPTPVFDVGDRVALATLASVALADEPELLDNHAGNAAVRLLLTAARLTSPASSHDPQGIALSVPEQRTELALGRGLGRALRGNVGEWLPELLTPFADAHPNHPLARALELELALERGSREGVALAFAEWPTPEPQRDRELLSGFLFELARDDARARAAYERALTLDPTCEAAVRALLGGLPARETAELLERLGDAETSGGAAALHFIEAGLRGGGDDAQSFHSLLEKALEADPKLVLPYRLGEHFARRSGDAERLLAWLRARRPAISDRLELALDLTREALLVAESELEASAALLREASELCPNDLAITELYERVADSPEFDRAASREAAAARATSVAKRRLLLEAAYAHERASDPVGAIRAARAAFEVDSNELARTVLERTVLGTSESVRLAEELINRAKDTDDTLLKREIYEQLSEIDLALGNHSSALLWQSAILDRSPRDLSALKKLEFAYLRADRTEDLEPVLSALGEALSGADGAAAARLAARFRLLAGNWNGARPLAELALREDPHSLWALRTLSAHARVVEDAALSEDVERRLAQLSKRSSEKATLTLRAGEAAARLERWDDARNHLEQTLEQAPDHIVALKTLAHVIERREDYPAAARTAEILAEASRVAAHSVDAWYRAGVLWLDHAGDPARGRAALERAVALDLGHDDAVARLQAIYLAAGERQRLAELLERRLERTTDPEERIAIEVARGRALAEIGEGAAAKAALAMALAENPNHMEALEAFTELCLNEGDWLAAEQSLIRLARHAGEPARQAQIYKKLGELYDVALPNPERAELAYQEVLKREPNDATAIDRLIAVYGRLGTPERAIALASQMLERADKAEERRERTIRLSFVLEQLAGNKKQAEITLDKARREWPHDASVLRALTELYRRNGDQQKAQLVLDRAAMDARRALGTGRFESALFETLATVADLRGFPDGAAVSHATLAALAGDEMPVQGGGPQAGDPALDNMLAPELLNPAMRALLRETSDLLDQAYPHNPKALRAAPLPPSAAEFVAFVRELGASFGLTDIEILVSPTLGLTCMPASSSPPTLIFGHALLETADDAARYCLIVRALTVLRAGGAAIARTAPVDLGPLMGALLGLLDPNFSLQGADTRKLADARAKLEALQPSFSEDVKRLTSEVTSSLGNRASQLATAVYQWGNRTALLAVGDPLPALRAVSFASGGSSGIPAAGTERTRWIVRNPEARDLMIFSVSEAYSEARRRLNLGRL